MNKDGLIGNSTIEDVKETEDLFSEACQYDKQHRLPFKSSSREKSGPGELIHSDVCGKMSQESVGGANYFNTSTLLRIDFQRPVTFPVGPAERRSLIKHPDNLHPEGEFVGRSKKDTPLKGD